MLHQPASPTGQSPCIGSIVNSQLRPGDVIVPFEADRDPELLHICGTATVTAVDFAPQGPCCLPARHMSIATDRQQRHHQYRDEPVKIIAPGHLRGLADTCRHNGWHLRRSTNGVWFASHIGTDRVYRRLWPAPDNHDADPAAEWGWGASYDGRHLGSGTGSFDVCWHAVNHTTAAHSAEPVRGEEGTR